MIIETDSKLDPEEGSGSAADRTAKIRNQKDRQEKATLLVREVTCQAIHGKNPKHMLIDCIDYLEPNLVIVEDGLTSSKTSLMGSVSHYLVQKSSVPVEYGARRRRTLPKVYKKKFGVVPSTSTLPPPLPSQQEEVHQPEGKFSNRRRRAETSTDTDAGSESQQDGEDESKPASSFYRNKINSPIGLSGQVSGDGEGGDPGVQTKAELIDKDPKLVSFAK
ncbi:hypothetical protein H4Q26_004611 [Puccinia striiformis f. sp. tritici PST-130]|nr:hypothetical protein H4Q26_004611 [Puccinia striiformis f. sp. tritici PST-130]